MEKLPMCRICLAENVRMHIVANRNLHELYEKLTDIPFVTKDTRPILACFFCCTKLKQCYQLLRQCLKAEELYAQMMNEDYKLKSVNNQNHLEVFSGLMKSPIQHISIVDECQTGSIAIKDELPADCEGLDNIIEPKLEHQSDQLELKIFDSSGLDVADIPPHHSESDAEDDVPLMIKFKTAVKEEQAVSQKKRRAMETNRATVAKKPKLDTRKTNRRKSAKELYVGFLPGVPEDVGRRRQSALALDTASVLPQAPGTPAVLPAPLPPPWATSAPSATVHQPSRHLSWTPPPPQVDTPHDECPLFRLPTSSYSHLQSEAAGLQVPSPAAYKDVDAAGSITSSPAVSGLSADLVAADSFGSDVDAEDRQADDIDVDGLVRARPSTLASDSPAVLEDIDPTILNNIAQMDRQNDIAMRATLPIDRISFDWRSDMAAFTGVRDEFTGIPGPTFPMSEIRSPVDVFLKIWDQPIMSLIERETNEYAAQCLDRPNISASSRTRRWHPTSVHELYVFFALMIHQSLHPMTVESEYFYPSSRATAMPFFKEYISYNRLVLLKKFLHFSNNGNISESHSLEERRIHKIQPINTHLNRKFQDLYLPGQNVAINESLLKRQGHLTFIQKIATKAAKTGINSYELCESDTGYLWKYYIYAGMAATTDSQNREDQTDRPDQTVQADGTDRPDRTDYQPAGATAKVVYDLASPLFGKGYTLIMDNFYNSPLLARSLKLRGTDCYGTLRLNRENVPDSVKYLTKLQMRKGDVVSSTSGDINVIVWKDDGLVGMLSTYHKVEVGATEKYGHCKFKPRVVLDYNQAMGGVDKKDQMLANFPLERVRNSIWYKKLFRRLLNISVQNAFIIYKCKDKSITHRNFRLQVAEGLLKSFWQQSVPPQIPLRVEVTRLIPSTLRAKKPRVILQNNHFSVKITQAPLRRSCVWCAENKNPSRTAWMCDVCDLPLCIECMKPYHTQLRV